MLYAKNKKLCLGLVYWAFANVKFFLFEIVVKLRTTVIPKFEIRVYQIMIQIRVVEIKQRIFQ